MSEELTKLAKELDKIEDYMVRAEKNFGDVLKKVHRANKKNAINLLHYLALRSLDIRELQAILHAYGLSSLASSESHVKGQLLAISQRIDKNRKIPLNVFNYETSKRSLHKKSLDLFGKKQNDSVPYIMVTFDSNLAEDIKKVQDLLKSGMNVARINCAHDDEKTWLSIIQQIKKASANTGLGCKIYMDLAGPKIRTVIKDPGKLKIKEGQILYLTDKEHLNLRIRIVGCSVAGISEQLRSGEIVLFDDGLIETVVEKIEPNMAVLRVLRISSKKPFIKNDKGINFPESTLLIPALTDFDKMCLPFIVKYADMLGYSFVRSPNDIMELREALGINRNLPLVIKIETPEAVRNLPNLLFCGMQQENIGVMIARGDLAVEIGFERMSEIQEEILWICEAAHVPVIWATQVLENLNKSGLATRSEITDAAHAAQADCVMINKGTHVIQTVETLRDVLLRSSGHHIKKRYTFRPLAIALRFMGEIHKKSKN